VYVLEGRLNNAHIHAVPLGPRKHPSSLSGFFDGGSNLAALQYRQRMSVADSGARVASLDGEVRSIGSPREALVTEFREVYKHYFSFVWSCTRRMGVDPSDVDDVVQEIFIVIHGKVATLEQPESLRSWIYGIVRRTASTYHRAKRAKLASVAAFSSEPEMQYPHPLSPLELAEQSDQVRLLWSLLAKLDPPKREAFVLAEFDDMTVPEIASAIDVPLNTVYSRLRTAKLEIEAALAKHHAQTGQRGRA